ncbi:MAG: hypothetical protein ACI85J_000247 [Candidatus Poriferisodalaceae bacterium]|jgi:hypothetical protein|tara:strand:- start:8694 stop:8897 length:204 start_codon:yes stop_codon:yes gene_type:complete
MQDQCPFSQVLRQQPKFAKEWTAKETFEIGIVQEFADESTVIRKAIQRAHSLAHLVERREIFGWTKE